MIALTVPSEPTIRQLMTSHYVNQVTSKQKIFTRMLVCALVALFAVTHCWALLSWNALFWDDWTLLTTGANNILRIFKLTGFDLLGTFHVWFSPFGVGAYKVLTLCSLALMSFLVFLILRQYGFDEIQACCVTALFIAAPLNTSKIAAINVPGTLFATVFFLAWVLLLRDLQKPSPLQRLCVLALFSVAFYFPSSLAFFALPVMSVAWHAFHSSRMWSHRFGIFFRRADMLALPFAQFAIFRYFFFKPDASIAAEYHKFGIRSSRLQEAVDRIQADILLDMPWVVKIVLLILPLLLLLRLLKSPTVQKSKTIRSADWCLIVGLSACFFALLPYAAVGRLPVFSDWNSRYHLYLPFGFALVCWGICQYITAHTGWKWLGISAFSVMLLMSVWFSVSSYLEYANDWRKQQQLMDEMQKLSFVNPSDNIVFIDSVNYAKRRFLRHNEYTQMMLRAQPGWHSIALSYSQLIAMGNGSLKNYITKLGGSNKIKAEPLVFGLPSQWRWEDKCVVLKIYEFDGHVQIETANNSSTIVEPCFLAP